METVKIAISVRETLFHKAEQLARRLRVSRNRLFVLALEDFIRRQENRDLLDKINAAWAAESDKAEQTLRRRARRHHRRLVEGEW